MPCALVVVFRSAGNIAVKGPAQIGGRIVPTNGLAGGPCDHHFRQHLAIPGLQHP